jgi:hypothetical protein
MCQISSECNFDHNLEERVIFMVIIAVGKADGIRFFQDPSGILDRRTAGYYLTKNMKNVNLNLKTLEPL